MRLGWIAAATIAGRADAFDALSLCVVRVDHIAQRTAPRARRLARAALVIATTPAASVRMSLTRAPFASRTHAEARVGHEAAIRSSTLDGIRHGDRVGAADQMPGQVQHPTLREIHDSKAPVIDTDGRI